MRLLSLAAGTAPDKRIQMIQNAAAACFDAVGLRFDLDPPTSKELRLLGSALDATGLVLLDIEVIRIGTHTPSMMKSIINAAGELKAQFLLVVSDINDDAETTNSLIEISQQAQTFGIRVVLEFMQFTGIRDMRQAFAVVEATGDASIGVLIDPLHLARSGGHPSQISASDQMRLPYLQWCDAPGHEPEGGLDALIHEARNTRLPTGAGDLPLHELLRAVPRVPISVEVQNPHFQAQHTSGGWTSIVADHARKTLKDLEP